MLKSVGIVRKLDELGRIVIPKELRMTMDLKVKDPLEIYTSDEFIVLKKYQPACLFCGEADDTRRFHGKNICTKCLTDLANDNEVVHINRAVPF